MRCTTRTLISHQGSSAQPLPLSTIVDNSSQRIVVCFQTAANLTLEKCSKALHRCKPNIAQSHKWHLLGCFSYLTSDNCWYASISELRATKITIKSHTMLTQIIFVVLFSTFTCVNDAHSLQLIFLSSSKLQKVSHLKWYPVPVEFPWLSLSVTPYHLTSLVYQLTAWEDIFTRGNDSHSLFSAHSSKRDFHKSESFIFLIFSLQQLRRF